MTNALPRVLLPVIFVLVSCCFLSTLASKKCSSTRHSAEDAPGRGHRGDRDGPAPLTCPSYCCRGDDGAAATYCCSDCRLSLEDEDDCSSYQGYWRYFGFAVVALALLGLLAGLAFGVARLIRAYCCKERAASVGAAATAAGSSGLQAYPRATPAGEAVEAGAAQLSKKPPEYYEIFSVQPQPPPPPPPPPPYTQTA